MWTDFISKHDNCSRPTAMKCGLNKTLFLGLDPLHRGDTTRQDTGDVVWSKKYNNS